MEQPTTTTNTINPTNTTNSISPTNTINPIQKLQITYLNCNLHTVILMLIIVPSLILTGIIVKLSVYSEYNQLRRYCSPVDFFWGNNDNCSIFVEKTVLNYKNTDSFTNITSNLNSNKIQNKDKLIDIFNYSKFKEIMLANYLAIIDFIHSFNQLIILVLIKIVDIGFRKITTI